MPVKHAWLFQFEGSLFAAAGDGPDAAVQSGEMFKDVYSRQRVEQFVRVVRVLQENPLKIQKEKKWMGLSFSQVCVQIIL